MSKSAHVVLALIVLVASVGVFAYVATHSLFYAPDSHVAVATTSAAAVLESLPAAEQPARLLIPSLGIDARIQYLGVNAKGNMQAPSNFTDVGWYQYGTIPGQNGSAVMDGHVDNGLGQDGVFKHLDALKSGDNIYIETKEGTRRHFVVEEAVSYPYMDVPTGKVFNRADTARLNLITCEGGWVGSQKTYDHRRVVYAVLAP